METSSQKYTPGPWVVTKGLNCNVIRGAEETRRAAFGAEFAWRDYVASTWGGVNEANARLIAAAPELLDALQAARVCIHQDRTALADCHTSADGIDEDGAAGVAEYDQLLAQIDSAIAKATGSAA